MASFFGGDPSVSHFTLSIPFDYQRAKRDETRKALKTAGYKQRYFQFKNTDEKAKARAKVQAEAEATLWKAASKSLKVASSDQQDPGLIAGVVW